MARWNRFGAVYTDITGKFPGSSAADFGGQSVIEAALDVAAREVAAALTKDTYNTLTQPFAEELVASATAGQSSATLGFTPVVTGSVHLWKLPSEAYINPATLNGTVARAGYPDRVQAPQLGVGEVAAADFSVNLSNGAITLTGDAVLGATERLYAAYEVDVSSASYSLQSLADVVVLGAASRLGAKIYSENTQSWALVTLYQTAFDDQLEALRSGEMIPDEVRALTFYDERERSEKGRAGTVLLVRG